jgi:hypothetical protein
VEVLEPLVNLDGADIHGKILTAVQAAAVAEDYAVKGIVLALSSFTGESVKDSGDIPGAIQAFIDNTKKEYQKLISVSLDIRFAMGSIFGGGGGGGGSYSEGIGGTRGGGSGSGGAIQQFFESELFGSGGAEFYQTVKAILNYEVTNVPGDILAIGNSIIDAAKSAWETPQTWVKEIKLELSSILPDVPDVLLDFASGVEALGDFAPAPLQQAAELIRTWQDVTTAANEAAAAQQAAVSAAATPIPRGAGFESSLVGGRAQPSNEIDRQYQGDLGDLDQGMKTLPTMDLGGWSQQVAQMAQQGWQTG